MLEEALEHLVKGIVDHDDEVVVRRKELRRGEVLEVRVHPDDLGRVIGRSGRTASALRTVMGALAGGQQVRVDIVDTDRAASRRGRQQLHTPQGACRDGRPACPLRLSPAPLLRGTGMDVVVARIGKAHGLRGEVTVEVHTDAPQERFVPGARFRTEPVSAGPLDAGEHAGPQRHPRCSASTASRTAPRPRGCAASLLPVRHRGGRGRRGRVVREGPGRAERRHPRR